MDLFSISQMSRYSGIKPHTIRVWEQRYDALRPSRSDGNTRYYDNSQLRRLLNIVSLMDGDRKVSELCSMPDRKLFQLINESLQSYVGEDGTVEYYISQLIGAGMTYDEIHFEKIFSHCLLHYGVRDAYVKVIYPMLVRVGLLWAGDSIPPAQEHFISNCVRQKLCTAIDALPPSRSAGNSWLLFLPEDEIHEIGLLFASYLIRQSGRKVIYLGADVPFHSLVNAVKDTNPQNLMLFLVHYDLPEETNQYLAKLASVFPGKRIWVAGGARLINQVTPGRKINILRSVEDLEKMLHPVAGQPGA